MREGEAALIERFQCPGCVCGSDTKCGALKVERQGDGVRCVSHVLGTVANFVVPFALGMPTGFNRGPRDDSNTQHRAQMTIWVWPKGTRPTWDHLNVPVWRLERDGFLFVRTYSPRVDFGRVDVIEGGTAEFCPQAIDVAPHVGGMD